MNAEHTNYDLLYNPRLTVKEITKFSEPFITFQKKKGVFVEGVKFRGNAQASGLQAGDILVSVDGRPIEALDELVAAYEPLAARPKEQRKILIRILRNGYPASVVLNYEKDIEALEDEQ